MKRSLRLAIVLFIAAMPSLAFGQDKFFDSNGVRIRYLEEGMGEPVVLIHGYTGTAEVNWVMPGVFQKLAKNYRVIAIDCRGHGKSDKPHDAKHYGREMALDIVRLLDHLKIEKAHIGGYSMGAVITAKLLTMRPERFLTATLGGHGALIPTPEMNSKLFEQIAAEVEKGSMRTLLLALVTKGQPRPTDEQIKQFEAIALAGKDLAALAAAARSFNDLTVTEQEVAEIKVPTIAIIGTADPLIETVRKMKETLPALKVAPIEGANHMTVPGRSEFIETIQGFLKAAAGSQPSADVWQPLKFFAGKWDGTGTGKPGVSKVTREYRFVLNNKFLRAENRSVYEPQPKNAKGEVHDDWGMMGFDKSRKQFVFRQFHVEGFVIHYALTSISSDGKTIVFDSESVENIPAGWRARETYKIVSANEFVEVFELAGPGKDFEVYSEARLKRNNNP